MQLPYPTVFSPLPPPQQLYPPLMLSSPPPQRFPSPPPAVTYPPSRVRSICRHAQSVIFADDLLLKETKARYCKDAVASRVDAVHADVNEGGGDTQILLYNVNEAHAVTLVSQSIVTVKGCDMRFDTAKMRLVAPWRLKYWVETEASKRARAKAQKEYEAETKDCERLLNTQLPQSLKRAEEAYAAVLQAVRQPSTQSAAVASASVPVFAFGASKHTVSLSDIGTHAVEVDRIKQEIQRQRQRQQSLAQRVQLPEKVCDEYSVQPTVNLHLGTNVIDCSNGVLLTLHVYRTRDITVIDATSQLDAAATRAPQQLRENDTTPIQPASSSSFRRY